MPLSRRLTARCVLVALAVLFSPLPPLRAQGPPEHSFPADDVRGGNGHSLAEQPASEPPLQMRADYCARFEEGQEAVLLMRGHCELVLGDRRWTAPQMVIWETSPRDAPRSDVVCYLEGDAEDQAQRSSGAGNESKPWLLEHLTAVNLAWNGTLPREGAAGAQDPLYQRALQQRGSSGSAVRQAQFIPPAPGFGGEIFSPAPMMPRKQVSIGPRFLGERFELKWELSQNSIPAEYVLTVTGGVNIVISNVVIEVDGQNFLSQIDLTADKAVVWTSADRIGNISNFEVDENTPFQVYLEGNIVVRQGASRVDAAQAFYDINQHRGLLADAEIRTLLPELQGELRLRAAEVRQYSETRFHAKNGWFTTSEFGKPMYRIGATDIFLEERFGPDPYRLDPFTRQPDQSSLWVTSLNNQVLIGDFPILASPRLTGPAEDPHIPLRKFEVGYSGIFGWQVETMWDLDGLFGMQLPRGVDLRLQADYLSERGPVIAPATEYDFASALFGWPVRHEGRGQLYYINDHGTDNLGLGRRNLPTPDDNRGRFLWQNRTHFDPYTYLQLEVGHVFNDDRNLLEQFFEKEWDQAKDMENLAVLNHQVDNASLSLLGSVRSNDFNNQTNWLPKADMTILGEPVLGSPLVWSMHSSIGYGQLRQAEAPPDPLLDPFQAQPFYADSEGVVAMSRHELNLPFNLGPVNIVPYVNGEFAHWQEDLTGGSLDRWYGAAGVRSTIQFSKYMPQIRSAILGLNGLAHKVNFDLDYYVADASEDYSGIPQYNAFEENSQERFRERYVPIEFGGVLPARFDPRNYAIRSGAGRSITSPYHELVDDQQTVWLGMRNRWQTKVGPPENSRIIDWMELDLGAAIFPNADRDNFGETLGLISGRYAWHVGPRTSLLANSVVDIFDNGQRVWNVGVLSQRSARGSVYLGYREVDVGPIESRLVTGSFSYVMSPNLYVATFGAAFDVAEGVDRGESLTITRIGESFLLHFGLGYDRSRNNVGVGISFEPKFGDYGTNSVQLGSLLGIR